MKRPYEVVISGMSGIFPESENVIELEKNLMEKKNMVSSDDRIWVDGVMDVPHPTGKVPEKDSLDNSFFGIGNRLYEALDPHSRKSLETAFAAVCDAGVNPGDLSGTNTAAISCSCISEPEYEAVLQYTSGLRILGSSRSMQSNRIAFHLNLLGPSLTLDSSYCGCIEGIRYAHDMIERGCFKAALVVCCSFIYVPENSFPLHKLGKLNLDGLTKCFSDDADGYSRSEACVGFFLQRREDALRSYGSVLGVTTEYTGSKDTYYTDIKKGAFTPILKEFYNKIDVNPSSVSYLEAASVAIKEVDADELNCIAEVLLPGRKGNLLIGCVKSNLGHCEAAADGVALAKVLISANTGIIPPNLHYSSPNSLVPALDNKLKVVTELTPLPGDIIALDTASIAGSFTHTVIKRFGKEKAVTPRVGVLPPDGLPRLFIMTGRNKDETLKSLEMVENMPIDPEFIALSNRLFKHGIKNHMYRCYTILNDKGLKYTETSEFFTGQKPPPVWFVFTGMGSQWPGMATQLMKIPVFAKAIHFCHDILKPKGVDLLNVVTTTDTSIFDNILNSFVGIAAVQIGLVDLLRDIGVVPDGIIGHSVGELGCAYADGCFTAEQMILAAYARGKASIDTELIRGMMAAVGLGYHNIKDMLPDSIEVACHNSKDSCTLSGPADDMKKFIDTLVEKQIFAKLVNVSNIAYHSKHIKPAAPALLKYLQEVVKTPKLRSEKWVSTSVPEDQWNTDLAKYCSAEYHTNNLLSSVLFEEGSKQIPDNAVIIEISPHGLLQAILKRSFPLAYHVPLTKRGHEDSIGFLLQALGKLFLKGISMNLEKLYHPVEYPVSRGTPSLSFLINWEHSLVYSPYFKKLKDVKVMEKTESGPRDIELEFEGKHQMLKEYKWKGVPVIPIGAYLELLINEFKIEEKECEIMQIKNFKMKQLLPITSGTCNLFTCLQRASGQWELCNGINKIVQGEITYLDKFKSKNVDDYKGVEISGKTFYEYLTYLGLELGTPFKLIKSYMETEEGVRATVTWNQCWTTFLEAILNIPLIFTKDALQFQPISELFLMNLNLQKFPLTEIKDVTVVFSKTARIIYTDGLEIIYPTSAPVTQSIEDKSTIKIPKFFPYLSSNIEKLEDFLLLAKEIVVSNMIKSSSSNSKLCVFQILDDMNIHNELCDSFKNVSGLKLLMKDFEEDKNISLSLGCNKGYENILIVAGNTPIENSLNVLKSSSQGFILLKRNSIPYELSVIVSQIIGNSLYSLCTYGGYLEENTILVSLSSNEWKSEVQKGLNKGGDKLVYLVGCVSSLPRIFRTIHECDSFPNSDKLRFIFHDSSLKITKPLIYDEQIQKGLRINIYSQGQWGTYTFKNINLTPISDDLKYLNGYKFSQLRMENTNLQAVGLPARKCGRIDVIEYSGVRNGKNVCGLATLDENLRIAKPDPIFQWNTPKNWSHDEIASVLMPYSMAYYILETSDVQNYAEEKSSFILVTHGCLPLSQAIINCALKTNLNIFTTYQGEEEREKIRSLFPQIQEDRIISCYSPQCLSNVIYKTMRDGKPVGMKAIVNNFMDEKMIYPLIDLLAFNSTFFQTGFSPETLQKTIGMNVFIYSVTVCGLTPSAIMETTHGQKRHVTKMVQMGLDSGSIKPFPVCALSDSTSSFEIKEFTKNRSEDNRLIISKTGTCLKKSLPMFLCEPQESYLVLVREKGHLWIEFVEWLIKRGATKIHIAIDWKEHTEFFFYKLNDVIKLHSSVEINTERLDIFDNLKSLQSWMNSTNGIRKLRYIFIFEENDSSRLKNICDAAKDSHILYFNRTPSDIFENEKRNDLQIIDANHLLPSETLFSVIDSMIRSSSNALFIMDNYPCNILIDNLKITYDEHLPWNVKEMLAFTNSCNNVGWKEERTNTLNAKYSKEVPPIFIFQSLKRGSMDKLLKSLFNPIFEAIIPDECNSLSDLAYQLFKEIRKFKCKVFTLICSDWSSNLGIELGMLLEKDGCSVAIVYFDPSFNFATRGILSLVSKNIMEEVEYSSASEHVQKKVQKGLRLLKNRFDLMSTFPSSIDTKLQGCFIVVKRKTIDGNDSSRQDLQEYCENPLEVVYSDESSFIDMINCKTVIDTINSISLVENLDGVQRGPRVTSLCKFLENPRCIATQKLADRIIEKKVTSQMEIQYTIDL